VSDPDPGAPELVVGAWRGYRIWRMASDRLTGCWYTGYAWAPGSSEASCAAKRWTRKGRRARHPGLAAPQGGCRCGLYALQEPWDFAGYLPYTLFGVTDESKVVIGVVAGWGEGLSWGAGVAHAVRQAGGAVPGPARRPRAAGPDRASVRLPGCRGVKRPAHPG
jgi:hypothetical protein